MEPANGSLSRIYLVRAAVAVVWAGAFAGESGSLGRAAVGLLIAYPVIDVVASLADARRRPRAGVQLMRVNAVLSAAAVAGIAFASTGDVRTVLRVFGSWAVVSGVIQLVVALHRRRTLGHQWAILLSGLISTIAGIGFIASASATNPSLTNLSGYALLGALFFIASAIGLPRRAQSRRPRSA